MQPTIFFIFHPFIFLWLRMVLGKHQAYFSRRGYSQEELYSSATHRFRGNLCAQPHEQSPGRTNHDL